MPKGRNRQSKLEHLALHVASGGSVASFARDNEIHVRTAYAWTKLEGFDEKVSGYRASTLSQIVGRLSNLGGRAVKQMGALATGAESENVRLAASRGILADLVSVGTYAVSMSQFNELQARVEQLAAALEVKSASDANGTSK
jgi:hypothetical protein